MIVRIYRLYRLDGFVRRDDMPVVARIQWHNHTNTHTRRSSCAFALHTDTRRLEWDRCGLGSGWLVGHRWSPWINICERCRRGRRHCRRRRWLWKRPSVSVNSVGRSVFVLDNDMVGAQSKGLEYMLLFLFVVCTARAVCLGHVGVAAVVLFVYHWYHCYTNYKRSSAQMSVCYDGMRFPLVSIHRLRLNLLAASCFSGWLSAGSQHTAGVHRPFFFFGNKTKTKKI